MPKVYNKYHGNAPADAVYVGRPTKWGNPFPLDHKQKGRDREAIIAKYREYVYSERNVFLREQVKKELKGKDLVCFCAPKLCHADILLEIANEE